MKISVVTATYNCRSVLPRCLASVSAQSYHSVEHIVIDGASTDGTLDLLYNNKSKISVLVSEPDSGIYDALNKGISCSSGEIIGFLHSDDTFMSNDTLKMVADIFEKDQSVSAVYGDLIYVQRDRPDIIVRRWNAGGYSENNMIMGWMPPHPTLYVRREIYDIIGGFDTRYRISSDYFSVLKMFSLKSFKVAYLPHVMIRMQTGGISNRGFFEIIQKTREDMDSLRRCNYGRIRSVFTLVCKNVRKVTQFIK